MKFTSLLLFIWFCTFNYAQTVTVTNIDSKEPVEMAILRSESLRTYVETNAGGQADISELMGAEDIEIRAYGYERGKTTYSEIESNSFEIMLTPSFINLDDVVASANRWEQDADNIPSRIKTITPKDIALQNPQTAADLLGTSGEVFIQKSQQGGGSPMIRGFATNRLLYTVDGVRMNTAIFRGGNIQNVISLDPFATEQAEVLFGPGSVIYGSDAIGGVMSFKTLTPQLSVTNETLIHGKALLRYSTANNEKTGHLDINAGWKKLAILTSISANDYDDLKMGSYGPEEYLRPFYVERIDSADVIVTNDDPKVQKPSGYSQINLMQKIRFKPNNKWNFEYGFHYSETTPYARYDRHIRYKDSLPRYGEWNYGPQIWMMNNLTVTHRGRNVLYDEMRLRLAQQYFQESRISRNFNDLIRENNLEEVYAYSGNLDFQKSIGKKNKLFYGFEAVWNDVNSLGNVEDIIDGIKFNAAARYPESSWASYGVYLTDQLNISEKFIVQAGVRYNQVQLNADFDTTFYPFPFTEANLNNGALTGSVGFVIRPTEKWVISMNGATAFRSPNVDDMGKVFDSEPGAVVVPNPDLKAEYAYNADISIAKQFGKVIEIDVTGYYTYLKNAMVRRDYALNGLDSIYYAGELSQVQALQNAAVAYVYGFQAGFELNLPAGFGLTSYFNYQLGEEELEDGTRSPSRHAAPWFGITRLKYTYRNLILELNGQYSGAKSYEELPESEQSKDYLYAKDVNGNPYSPAWYTLNFKAMYKFATYFVVSGGVENITDQRYRPYSSGMAGAGRNFILSFQYQF